MPTRRDEEVLKAVEVANKLVKLLPSNSSGLGRRELIQSMLEDPIGNSFFTAPASSRAEYHSCYPGGLLVHSLNVIRNLQKLAEALFPGKFAKETLVFVGLFHDLGKAGDGDHELYVQNKSDWHRQKGILYEINKDCPYMPTSERGLFVLQKYEISLSSEEYLAIRLNDGQYVKENEPYRMKEPTLALLLHWADRAAVDQEKAEVLT